MNPRSAPSSGKRVATNAVDCLRTDEKMASLMPNVMRLAAIRKDCAAILPKVFEVCAVQRFEAGSLVLSVPNAALVTRLKQQLPKLQEALCQSGWQISSIRLKVQMMRMPERSHIPQKTGVSPQGLEALSELVQTLKKTPQNAALELALQRMLQRHR